MGPILVAGARDQRRGSAIPASSITQKPQPLTPLQADPPAPGLRFFPPAQRLGTKTLEEDRANGEQQKRK